MNDCGVLRADDKRAADSRPYSIGCKSSRRGGYQPPEFQIRAERSFVIHYSLFTEALQRRVKDATRYKRNRFMIGVSPCTVFLRGKIIFWAESACISLLGVIR